MTEHADPAGFEQRPLAFRYRIRDRQTGEIVERLTEQAIDPITRRWHHALHANDQEYAVEIRGLIQRACGYFYAPDEKYEPLEGVREVVISDDEIHERIDRMNRGENLREAVRTHQEQYPFDALPWDQQRALVEQIEAVKQRYGFEIIGESPEPVGGVR